MQQLFYARTPLGLKRAGKRVYSRAMRFSLQLGTVEQAPEISALRLAVAAQLTAQFGRGPWSRSSTVKGVLFDLRNSVLYIVMRRNKIIATLALCAKRPWATDPRYFTKCRKPLYLVSMAIAPGWQRKGIGRRCLTEVGKIAAAWPADAIRLDAYDAAAGAGEFYRRCHFTEAGRGNYRGVSLIYFEKVLQKLL